MIQDTEADRKPRLLTTAKRVLFMLLGYVLAVLSASILTVICVVVATEVLNLGKPPKPIGILEDVGMLAMVGVTLTAVYALPGWALCAGLAEWFDERRRWFFVSAGGLNAVLAHALLLYSSDGTTGERYYVSQFGLVILLSVLGGLCGGWVYWRLAGRNAGAWRASR
jgi:hypothetical protein